MPASLRATIQVGAYERARRRFGKSYEVVKVPGGHFMHREHPDQFIAELLRLLRTASACGESRQHPASS